MLAADLALNSVRPAWVVLGITLAVVAIAAMRALTARGRPRPGGRAPAYVAAAIPANPQWR